MTPSPIGKQHSVCNRTGHANKDLHPFVFAQGVSLQRSGNSLAARIQPGMQASEVALGLSMATVPTKDYDNKSADVTVASGPLVVDMGKDQGPPRMRASFIILCPTCK